MRNFLLLSKGAFMALCVVFFLNSCGKNDNKEEVNENKTATVANTDGSKSLPNYRYVDLDSLYKKYNLSKDYSEEMLRMQDNMEAEVKRHENKINSKATTMQNKLQNNGYLTEASLNADREELNTMQAEAQRAVAALQNNLQNAALASELAVSDSIRAFIKDYNAKKGYDAIFIKATTLYIDPALDITDEIVEGLNARYNKVK